MRNSYRLGNYTKSMCIAQDVIDKIIYQNILSFATTFLNWNSKTFIKKSETFLTTSWNCNNIQTTTIIRMEKLYG